MKFWTRFKISRFLSEEIYKHKNITPKLIDLSDNFVIGSDFNRDKESKIFIYEIKNEESFKRSFNEFVLDDSKFAYFFKKSNIALHSKDLDLIFVFLKNPYDMHDVCFYTNYLLGGNNRFVKRLKLLEIELKNYNTITLDKQIFRILEGYDVSICDNIVILKNNIEPNKYIDDNLIIKDIPLKDITAIKGMNICLDSCFHILSVKLNGFHPNADENGYYCLGNFKYMVISKTILDNLIQSIKIYNLDSCYKYPEWYK